MRYKGRPSVVDNASLLISYLSLNLAWNIAKHHMPFGLFGPVTFKTKRGTRVTFVAGFITLPLTAWSLYQIFGPSADQPPRRELPAERGTPRLPPPPPDVDLSDK